MQFFFFFMFSELIRFYCHRACVSSNALAIGAVPPPAPVRPPATVLPSPDAAVAPGRSSEQVQQSPPLSYTGFGLNRTDYYQMEEQKKGTNEKRLAH